MIPPPRKIVYYPEASLDDLDAGVVIAYPLSDKTHNYYAVPSFLIIGAQKCGTRELHTWLSQHPNLKGASEECHFFDEVIDIKTEWIRYLLNPDYLLSKDKQYFVAHPTYTFEKTPAYWDKSNRGIPVPKLVQQMMPTGKFIIMLRNPVTRAYSAYQMGKTEQKVISPITKYVKTDFLSLVKKEVIEPDPDERLLNIGHYAFHLKTWLEYFSRDQIYIVVLEDFKQRPFEIMDKILTFLNLRPFDYRLLAEKNSRGLWIIKDQASKGNNRPYKPLPDKAKELLDEYYAPWNRKLKKLIPELYIPW